ncbi:cyanophycin synthetase [Inediibacterium massiliense]|uniref:cyanophycin synthetase n=1 Tax=Inediibacterium massiliense TaxID=1658111 RepID=UPI0006B60644|nr:cyanophycin synthetase [Inediibacterium massiliense]
MKIISIRKLQGRNAYSHQPVIKMTVDLENFYCIPTCQISGFNDQLLKSLPTLWEHKCSKGYRGGFVERLSTGTYLAHVMEHVSIELQNLMGYSICYGKARRDSQESVYNIIFEYLNEVAGLEAGKLSFDFIQGLLDGNVIDLNEKIKNIKNKAIEIELGPSTKAIQREAKKMEIPVIRIGKGSILQLGYGAKKKLVQATLTEKPSCISVDISCDKELTNEILRENNIPVPNGTVVYTKIEALQMAKDIGYPVVLKPYNGNQGKNVYLNLKNEEEVLKAFQKINKHHSCALVEEYIKGKHYRILVVKNKVVAVAQRVPAHVIGDGIHSIQELIEIENQNPNRGEGHEKPLTKIKIDDVLLLFLHKSGQSLEDIPPLNKVVYVRENDNLSTGGTAIDVTEWVNEEIKRICIKTADLIGLDVAGIDVTTTDITKTLEETKGAIIEVNAAPGIRMHHYPSAGMPRNVAKEIIKSLFEGQNGYSIPVVSVTGTNGKTTTTRMIGNILKHAKHHVGMTTTGGIYIGDECIEKGDTTGPKSAKKVLMNKYVTAAVLETARGGIVNRGLGYDLADVGVITNIENDHLGLDGVEDLEDLANIKSLVVEAIKKDGYGVLNGDDPYCMKIKDRVFGNVLLFSKDENNIHIKEHVKNGGEAVYIRDKSIYFFHKKEEIKIMNIEEIPATYGGILIHNIENSLAAIAAACALKMDTKVIYNAMSSFKNDEIDNPGRFNVYPIKDFKVIVDYGHNYDGYKKTIESLKKMKYNQLIGVIGVPGDRLSEDIHEVAKLSGANFDFVWIKEDRDLRGREKGEVANILYEGCIEGGMKKNNIDIELVEEKALEKAMNLAKKGDMIVVFYEDREKIIDKIEEYKKKHEKSLYKELILATH